MHLPGIEFEKAFRSACSGLSISNLRSDELLELVPASLRSTDCCSLPYPDQQRVWKYCFSAPYRLGDGKVAFDFSRSSRVEVLVGVLDFAERRLCGESLSKVVAGLGDSEKHLTWLGEFAPVMRISDDIPIDCDVAIKQGSDNDVDWAIGFTPRPVFLEVKTRTFDMFQVLKDCADLPNIPGVVELQSPPSHDPSRLLKSIEKKFPVRQPDEALQGGWVNTGVRQPDKGVRSAFDELDHSRVHFVILGDWSDEACVLARDGVDRCDVASLFGRTHDENRLFKETQ